MNRNNRLKLLLLSMVVEFLNILNNEKIKIKDIRINEQNKKYISQEKIFTDQIIKIIHLDWLMEEQKNNYNYLKIDNI